MIFQYSVIIEYNWSAIAAVCIANFTATSVVIFIATLANAFGISVVTIINLHIVFNVIQYRMSIDSYKLKCLAMLLTV